MQRENVALQAFAAEVFKRDPALYREAIEASRRFVETRKRAWHERSKRGELEALDTANAVVGMMKLLGKTDIRDVPDVSDPPIAGARFHR